MASGTLIGYLTGAGIGSRRHCFRLIKEGRVTVNGRGAEALSMPVDPDADTVLVDDQPVAGEVHKVYLKVNKPRGVISTTRDDRGRRTVMSMAPRTLRGLRLFPVGRLDADTTGLLLLTNDGELANGLMHPRYGVEKEYHVELDGGLTEAEQMALEEGVVINGERTSPAEVSRLWEREGAWYSIVLKEGRKRQIRMMLVAVGRGVRSIQRVRIHNLRLGRLPEGQVGELSKKEVSRLREVLDRETHEKSEGPGGGMSFTSELQRGVAPLWEKMVTHRFVKELGDGTLPREKFQRYFEQDYVFLRQGWIHLISLGIAKSPDFDSARTMAGFLNSVLDGEEGLFQRAFREMGLSEEDVKGLEALPTTYAFASYLTNVAYQGGFKEIITAFMCVEWTYLDWAQRLEAAGKRPGNEYYQGWIDVHAGAELEELVRWMREVLDAEPPEDEERLRGIFLDCLRYEYMFWEMAYGREGWPQE